jgi:hypothetical protein
MKMIIKIWLWLAWAMPLEGQAQSIDQLFKGKTNCSEIELMALDVIPGYYRQGQLDSIELIIDFVSLQCLENTSLRITRFLLLIDQNRFSDTLLSALDLYYIKRESQQLHKGHLYNHFLQQTVLASVNQTEVGDVFWRKEAIESKYMDLISDWTGALAGRSDLGALEKAVVHHLQPAGTESNGTGMWALSAKKNGYLALPFIYNQYHRDYVILRSWQFTVGAGQFIATGAMRPLMGSRTSLMFSIGKNFGHPKNRIDFGGNFTFGQTRNAYTVVRPDTTFSSRDAYASFAYLDFVRNIWRPNRFWEWNVSLGAGIAEKGIYKPESEDETIENEPAEIRNNKMGKAFIIKPALFFGTELKIFLAPGVAFNTQAKYNLFNWGNIGGAPFSGNAITINAGLSFHFGGHPTRGADLVWNSMLD